MLLLADSENARKIDKDTIQKYGIPSILLMENAGMRVADEAYGTGAHSFAVVCGKGNNGGDGSAAARHLHCMGASVTLIMLFGEETSTSDARSMLEYAKGSGVKVVYGFTDEAKNIIAKSEVIVDAVFGIGLKGNPDGVCAEAIDYINRLEKYVIAVDVPSGVCCDSGEVFGSAVMCKKTVTFGVGRLGLMLYPAKKYAGKVCVREISFVPGAVDGANINIKALEYAGSWKLDEDCHKGSVGRVLLAAGSAGMTGAACIASTAALRCGAGVVTLCVPEFLNPVMEEKLTEIMTVGVADNGRTMAAGAFEEIVSHSEKYDVLVMGCGLGNNEDTKELVNRVINRTKCDVVLDADGLNCLDKDRLADCAANVVVTPHIGEMARLTGLSADEIKRSLVKTAAEFAKRYKIAVVLKCATTVVAFPDGEVYVNTNGNSGMATAGSGDALAGIIGAEIAAGDDFKAAVLNGVWLHSAAGDNAAKRLGKRYMSALDIVDSLQYILRRF